LILPMRPVAGRSAADWGDAFAATGAAIMYDDGVTNDAAQARVRASFVRILGKAR